MGHWHQRQATKQLFERCGGRNWRMTGGKQFQEALFKFWMLLVKNGVGHQIDQGGDIKQARQWDHLALEFEGVGHR